MQLSSTSEFGEYLPSYLSQEQKNSLVELRYVPWDGKFLHPGERLVVQLNAKGRDGLMSPISDDAYGMLQRAYGMLENHFLLQGKTIKRITFIQERRPNDELGIANTGAGMWHNHIKDGKGNALIVLDDEGGTEFIEGSLEVKDTSKVTHQEVKEALDSGKVSKKLLKAGHVGHFNNETLHKRAGFFSGEPRVAIVVEFED